MFGVPGGGPNLDMIGCAEELGIDFVLAHGESAACVMAASYGRLTGTPGAAVVTRGPGLTSAANGLAQASLDRFPLVLVSDSVNDAEAARVAHQRLDQVGVTRPITKWSGVIGSHDPRGVAAAAGRLALTAPYGAVHCTFDPTVEGDLAPEVPGEQRDDPGSYEEVRRLCGSAYRPVVIVGLDAARKAEAVRAALEPFTGPVLVTYEAKGTVPESWSSYAGLFTGGTAERALLQEADLVLAVGLDPVEPTPAPWDFAARVVMLHSHAVETEYFGEPRLVVGPYDEHLKDLVAAFTPTWPGAVGRRTREAHLERLRSVGEGFTPANAVTVAQETMPDALLTVDAGAHMLVAMPIWPTDEHDSVLISNGLATMGFALPAAIGAALARPDRRVVCLLGDGGLGMVLAELETLARSALDVTVLVLNDSALTLIRLKQKRGQGDDGAVVYGDVDFAGVARSLGLPATTVGEVDGLRSALQGPESEPGAGPLLVDARIDPSSYSHVFEVTRG